MDISKLTSIIKRPKKRIGRGHGSGKVKTSGRGTKGQKARDSIKPGFEGGQLSILRRLPLLRGKGRNKSLKGKPFPLQVGKLESIPKGTTVTLEILKKYHMIESKVSYVKILGGGTLTHPLIITLPVSQSAREAIEKSGGTIEIK